MFEVVIEERAELEYYAALEYYERLDILGLAERFYDDYTNVVRLLEINPHFEIRATNYRAIPFDNFPFIAIFTVEEAANIVRIVSIFHTAQNPNKYPV